MLRRALVASMVAAVLTVSAGAAMAGGKTVTPSSITLNQSQPALGTTVTFTVSYPSTVKDPRIQVMCFQNAVEVWGDAGAVGTSFLLGSAASPWLTVGGPASCEADLYYFIWNGNHQQQFVLLASTFFNAAG